MRKPTTEKQELFFNNLEHKNHKYEIAHQFLKNEKVYYIYFLINYDQIVYVGKSINYQARITAHNFEYNLIRVIKTNKQLADKWETKLIKKYQPIHNKEGITCYKAYLWSKDIGKNYHSITKVRKYNILKPKLNVKFKQTHIKHSYYIGKDSRNIYYNFDDYVKKNRAKFWSFENKRINFYTFTPDQTYKNKYIGNTTIYPVSKKLEEI
jgi:hypothetical protein